MKYGQHTPLIDPSTFARSSVFDGYEPPPAEEPIPVLHRQEPRTEGPRLPSAFELREPVPSDSRSTRPECRTCGVKLRKDSKGDRCYTCRRRRRTTVLPKNLGSGDARLPDPSVLPDRYLAMCLEEGARRLNSRRLG